MAEAYAAGTPLRLALYEADYAYHSGKYFYSSENWYEEGRPTLSITWGYPVDKTVIPSSAQQSDPVTYSLNLYGTGRSLTLTDTLPVGVSAPGSFVLEGTSVMPHYQGIHHRLVWSDTVSVGEPVTLRYVVTITTSTLQALTNRAELRELGGDSATATTTIVANPHRLYLPTVFKARHE